MYWFFIIVFLVTILNINVIYRLFNKRFIGKLFIIIHIIVFIMTQILLVRNLHWDNFSSLDLLDSESLIILFVLYVITFGYYALILIRKIVVKKFIKKNVVKTNIKDDLLLAKFRYLYYTYNNNSSTKIIDSKIIHSDIYDVLEKKETINYLVVFYIYGKKDNKKGIFVNKVVFKKQKYNHLDKCPNCGAKVSHEEIYCSYCDTRIVNEDNIYQIISDKTIDYYSLSDLITNKKNIN